MLCEDVADAQTRLVRAGLAAGVPSPAVLPVNLPVPHCRSGHDGDGDDDDGGDRDRDHDNQRGR